MSLEVEPQPGRRGPEWAALIALMLAYAIAFVVEYPPLPGIEDEVGYLNQAWAWTQGAISAEAAGRPDLAGFDRVGGLHLPRRHPGRSLLALPLLVIGGVPATFVSGLLIHLATAAIGGRLLERLGRSPLWAALLLFHPTLALYSRTIMADEASGTGLLLAGLALTSRSPRAGVWAGLAVGLSAVMRYQAGLALPIVAATFLTQRDRPAARRDAALCFLAGSACGTLIAAYNMAVYGRPTDPFSIRPGYFGAHYIFEQLPFYGLALLAVWPGMLVAPALDRSPIRWLVRGAAGAFLGLYCFYYFHDRGPGRIGEIILGQRLLQVALPLWVVSYAGVADDWVAAPLRRLVPRPVLTALVALGCLGLLAATAVSFDRHQRHLETLLRARAELVNRVPEGSKVVYRGAIYKLVGVAGDTPYYRLREVDMGGQSDDHVRRVLAELDAEPGPWYLAVLHREPGEPFGGLASELVGRYALEPVPLGTDLVSLYVRRASSSAGPSALDRTTP